MADVSLSDIATGGVATQAIREMAFSQLPGRTDGPADAYRHLLLSAELTRSYGETYARAALDFHEWDGNRVGQTSASNRMDVRNNELGIQLGKQLQEQGTSSWVDVVDGSRKLIDKTLAGEPGAVWLDKSQWKVNPMPDDGGPRMASDDPRLNWPPKWAEGPTPNPLGRDAGEPYTDRPAQIPEERWDDLKRTPKLPEKGLLDRIRGDVESFFDDRYSQLNKPAPEVTTPANELKQGDPNFDAFDKVRTAARSTDQWSEAQCNNIAAAGLAALKADPVCKELHHVAVARPNEQGEPNLFLMYSPHGDKGPHHHVHVGGESKELPAQQTLQQVAELDRQQALTPRPEPPTRGGPSIS